MMRVIILFAALSCMALLSAVAAISSPAPGSLCIMPAWGATSIDAAHTPGNLDYYRIDQQTGLATYAALDGILERVFYTYEVNNTNAMLRAALPSDFDILISDTWCMATNRNFYGAGRRIVVPRDLYSLYDNMSRYTFPTYDYAAFFLHGTNVNDFAYFYQPEAWSCSLIEGPDEVPDDIAWTLYEDFPDACAGITNGVTTRNFQPGGAVLVRAWGSDASIYSEYATGMVQRTTYEGAISNFFPRVDFAALTNETLRTSTLSDRGRVGAVNATLAALDVAYCSGGMWGVDNFAMTNYERRVSKVARSTVEGVFTISNGAVTCSADFGDWSISSSSQASESELPASDNLDFSFLGGSLIFSSSASSSAHAADVLIDWEVLTNVIQSAVAMAARVLDTPDDGEIEYGLSNVQIDSINGNDLVISGEIVAEIRSFTPPVGRGSPPPVAFTVPLTLAGTIAGPVHAAVTASAQWSWGETIIPDALSILGPARPGYHAWHDDKVKRAQAFAISEAVVTLDEQGTYDDDYDYVRIKRYEYTSPDAAKHRARQDMEEVQAIVKALALDKAGISDINNAIGISDGDLVSLADTIRITGASIELLANGQHVTLPADDADAAKLSALRYAGGVTCAISAAIDSARAESASITKDPVRAIGTQGRSIFRIDYNWGSLRNN